MFSHRGQGPHPFRLHCCQSRLIPQPSFRQRIAEFLKQSGYPKVVNLAGGILAWSDEIDPRVQKY